MRAGIFAGLTLAYLGAYWLAARYAGAHVGGDTTAFEQAARELHGWSTLFATSRPPLYPLLIRLVDFSRPALVALQTIGSLLAWTALAATVAGSSLWVSAVVFYLALFPGFAAWNPVLMTESPQITLTVAAIACLLAFAHGRRWAFAGFVALMLLKSTMRDFDALVALFFVPMILAAAALRRLAWSAALAAAALLVGCYVFSSRVTGGAADATWMFALFDVVGQRILPDPALRQYFVAHGMPMSDALLSMTGRRAFDDNWRFWTDPALASLRDWLRLHGHMVYARYMLGHPLWTFAAMWQGRRDVFLAAGMPGAYYFDPRYRLDVPPWPPFMVVYGLDLVGVALLAVQAARRRLPPGAGVAALIAATLALMLPPLSAIVYHADTLELIRHALPVPLHAALCLVALLDLALRPRWATRAAALRAPALASGGWRSKSQLATGQGRGAGG